MFALRKLSRKLKKKHQHGKHILIIYTTYDFCLVYLKNSYNSKDPKTWAEKWTIGVDEDVKQHEI